MLGDVRAKLQRIRYSGASNGWLRLVLDIVSRLTTYRPDRDRSFDRRLGTDTGGRVETASLGIADAERQEQAILYLPSPARVTRWMLDNVGVAHRGFTFVDLGCGKGRVVLVAARYPFRRVLGVDISEELLEIARRNVQIVDPARRCADIEVVNADATTIDLPETDLWLHLYHPFDTEVTAMVLRKLQQSRTPQTSRVVIAYLLYSGAVPEVRAMFAEFPWLHETRYEASLFGHYDWLFYATA